MIYSELKCYAPKKINGIIVPCGHCYACALKKSNDWQIRLKEEYETCGRRAVFVTLTYDDEHVNIKNGIRVLNKKDVQLFHKRLRHLLPEKLNYFLVSEYGPTTFRPHYHGIYFNVTMYDYEKFVSSWQHGFITMSPVTSGRIGYVAKYSLLPMNLPEEYLKDDVKPFMLVSKGMGIRYLENSRVIDMHKFNKQLFYLDNGYKKSLPRYYRDKIFDDEQKAEFTEDFKKRCVEQTDKYWSMSKEDYDAYVKSKKDWIRQHSYEVRTRMVKKSKL